MDKLKLITPIWFSIVGLREGGDRFLYKKVQEAILVTDFAKHDDIIK